MATILYASCAITKYLKAMTTSEENILCRDTLPEVAFICEGKPSYFAKSGHYTRRDRLNLIRNF